MQRDYKISLLDIKDAIKRINAYTKGMSFEDFSSDLLVQDAVLRNLTVIGEAAKNFLKRLQKSPTKWNGKILQGSEIFLCISISGWTLKPSGALSRRICPEWISAYLIC